MSAATVIMAMLDARFGGIPATTRVPHLAPHQQDALERLLPVLQQFGGALLADSVGLGKTVTAAACAGSYIDRGRILVVAPSPLQTHWRRHMRRLPWDWCSHARLSRGSAPAGTWSLIIVDEAHAFRNMATRRYATLRAARGDAHLLLLSATPVNNTPLDLCSLIRLFAADTAFHGDGIPDLQAAFASRSAGARADMRRIAERVVVRRTRSTLVSIAAADAERQHQPGILRFPRNDGVSLLTHSLDVSHPGVTHALHDAATSLRFTAHRAVSGDGSDAVALMMIGLLKRAESGVSALRSSVTRHVAILDAFAHAARHGLLLTPQHAAPRLLLNARALQLDLDSLTLPPWPARRCADQWVEDAERDTELLRSLLAVLHDGPDEKLCRVASLLRGELAGARVAIFTEFQATSIAVWRSLLSTDRVGLVHGGGARLGAAKAARSSVIDRFAPVANRARIPSHTQAVRILVATDVLAEGMNLQDAAAVISWDMPWNPVRLAQRVGRIDRLGSPHPSIRAYAFQPDPEVDRMLRLMKRVRAKVRSASHLGSDTPRFRAQGAGAAAPAPHDQAPAGGHSRVSRLLDGVPWERTELLRAEWVKRHRAQGPSVEPSGEHPLMEAVACAAVPGLQAIWCIQRGNAVRLVHVLADPLQRASAAARVRIHDDPGRIDGVLLDVLRSSPCPGCCGGAEIQQAAWREKSRRAAMRWSRGRYAAGLSGSRDSRGKGGADRERLVRGVLRWLQARPGGPSPNELAEAERLILAIGRTADRQLKVALRMLDASDASRPAPSASDPAPDASMLARIGQVVCSPTGDAAPRRAPKMIAGLVLVPCTCMPPVRRSAG